LNWSDKVDRSEPIRIKPMSEVNARFYSLKYKEDKDYVNARYKTSYSKNYGDYIFDNNLEFSKDTQTTEIIFAPTPLAQDSARPDDKVCSWILKINNGVEDTTESIIRILQAKKIDGVSNWNIYDRGGNLRTQNYYGYAGHFDDPDVPSLDLNFGVPAELYYNLAAGALGNNLFNIFYSSYLAEITDINSKLFTCKMWLNEKDIYNLDFSKFIWIDGSLFRLNKIHDYTPGDLCKVDLLKVIYTTYSDIGNPNATPSVRIGSQEWTLKNLDTLKYNNGDAIILVSSKADWQYNCDLRIPTCCYYNYDPANAEYGLLYNWWAVTDYRGIAPSGYKVPSLADYVTLQDYLGGDTVAFTHMRETGTSHWYQDYGDNTSGFTAYGSGINDYDGNFYDFRDVWISWTSDEDGFDSGVYFGGNWNTAYTFNQYYNKCAGFALRCLKA
jgi:uncharacterized protein (TIGR02145 family)